MYLWYGSIYYNTEEWQRMWEINSLHFSSSDDCWTMATEKSKRWKWFSSPKRTAGKKAKQPLGGASELVQKGKAFLPCAFIFAEEPGACVYLSAYLSEEVVNNSLSISLGECIVQK